MSKTVQPDALVHDSTVQAKPNGLVNEGHGNHSGGLYKLAIGAVGVVFGDIGTSPIYAFRETFAGHHKINVDPTHIYGVLSLVFWSMMIVVTIKYALTIMRADNKGEGGSLALLALISKESTGKRWSSGIVILGVFATALFYGDSMITPAMSVLSATEGLSYVHPGFQRWIIPIAVFILFGLFAIQSRGTAKVGALFGPIMVVYFITLAVLGLMYLVRMPMIILEVINPLNFVRFFMVDGLRAFVAMGSVVLAVTGAEALYADMGHFGRKPIMIGWIWFVLPALMLNYMGQGAMILTMSPAESAVAIKDPFFFMLPGGVPCDHGHDHRQPGGDLRCVLAHPAGDPAWLHSADDNQTHQRFGCRADLYSGDQLGAADHGAGAGAVLPVIQQSCRRLWHCGDRRDGN